MHWLAFSQSTFGALTGTVSDSSGAVIVGANVIVTNLATMVSRTVITGTDGTYLALNLDAGSYRVAAEMQGFRQKAVEGIDLLARQTVRVNIELEVGTLGEIVEVTESVGVITTDTPTISDSISGREINELALNFRATDAPSPLAVATLVPGVQKDRDNQISISGLQPYTTS